MATTYSRGTYRTTTIGNAVFDGRVRDGIGSGHSFMVTKKMWRVESGGRRVFDPHAALALALASRFSSAKLLKSVEVSEDMLRKALFSLGPRHWSLATSSCSLITTHRVGKRGVCCYNPLRFENRLLIFLFSVAGVGKKKKAIKPHDRLVLVR